MSSPTQRSLKKLRDESWGFVAITEHWNPFAHIRQDLFGFIDLVAIRSNETLGIQTTSAANVSARFKKMQLLPALWCWLECPSRKIAIHGWAKRGARGQRKVWSCRVVNVVLGPAGCPVMEEI